MIHGDVPLEIPIPMTKTAIPRSEPWAEDDALAIAIEAHGPIPAAAIIKPAKVSVGELAKITSRVPDEIATNEKLQIWRRLCSSLVER